MKNTKQTEMFTVTCHVTGEEKKVRKPVFQKRVQRVQRLVRSITGDQITVDEAVSVLNRFYVGTAGRKQANVDFLNQPVELAVKVKPLKRVKAKTVNPVPTKPNTNIVSKAVNKVKDAVATVNTAVGGLSRQTQTPTPASA